MSGSNLLFILTGSIAGFKACDAISQLVQRGHRVRTVATESALRFIGPATLEGLTGNAVLTDLFASGAALEHIDLTRWADAVVVCPATANTINHFAAGLADDLAGALFLAHDRSKPFLIAPAMNPAMWSHPGTVGAVEKLSQWGVKFLPVGEGRTACGEIGEGRLAESAWIVAAVEAAVAKPVRKLRVLITSGGTAEPIDGVRVLTNTSTGRTGAGIASHFARSGHEVVLLRASNAAKSDANVAEQTFSSFAELDSALRQRLNNQDFDVVIHAAAVGDFGIEAIEAPHGKRPPGESKIDSDANGVTLRLKNLPKLVDSLRATSRNSRIKVVAFKLTHGATPESVHKAVEKLLQRSGADFVVHNDLTERGRGDAFPSNIHRSGGGEVLHCATRTDLAQTLEQLLVDNGPATA
jgi:phosphopantothenoylcysteine decarboxylase/phosphopantothenate--cysteine ligase